MAEAAPASGIQVGAMVGETYRVTELIGRGGMGSVWAAEHTRLPGKKVAIKVLHAEVAGDQESLARFRREAEIASRLGHANIVDVHDFNVLDDGNPYLILEYLEGEDLATRLARGPLPLDEVAGIIRQVGSALQAAHREDIIHRDLKPQNVFLCPIESGGVVTERAKVLDFGISKIRGSQTIKTNATDMLGTPQYMAPEQATGNHAAVDGRTDIFALGAMVYEMLSGRPAFQGQSIPEVVFKVVYEDAPNLGDLVVLPPGVVDAVHKALSKKQEDRFASVSDFVEALTGSPLTTVRGQVMVIPGDGASAGAPTSPRSDAYNVATAATQASGKRPTGSVGLAETIASGEHPATSPRRREPDSAAAQGPRRTGLIVALGTVVVVVATATWFLFLRGHGAGDGSTQTPTTVATTDRDPGHTSGPASPPDAGSPTKKVNTVTVDAGPADAATKKAVSHPTKKSDDVKRPDAKTIDPELEQQLAEARSKLPGNPDRAIQLAMRTLATTKTDAAYMIMARGYCIKHDLGMARPNYLKIQSRKTRADTLSFCRSRDVDVDPD